MLRAKDVDRKLVQAREEVLQIIGADVEALYPSLLDIEVAEIAFKAIMDSDISLEGIDYQEGARYIVLNETEFNCRAGPLGRVLPKRRFTLGARPGITGAGPMRPEHGHQDQ